MFFSYWIDQKLYKISMSVTHDILIYHYKNVHYSTYKKKKKIDPQLS